MRILLVTQWYPPEPQELLAELTGTLQELGHSVTVLTGFPNWPTGKLYPGYRLRLFRREELDGVDVLRVPLFPDHSHSAVRRAINFLSFALSLATIGVLIAPATDAIHVIHPPITVAVPAWLISRLRGVPLTLEIQDMWPETLKATGMVSSPRVLGLIGALAKWVYTRASAIRVISSGFKSNLIAKGVPADKVTVISNWVDSDLFQPVTREPELMDQLGLAGRFNVMYAGTIGLAQGLHTVLSAAELLRDLTDVQLVLVGNGADLARLRSQAESRGIENVRFLGRYPRSEMPRFYSLADVMLLHLRRDELFKITVPHKLFTYMASERPVLAAVEGDAAGIVKSAGAGVTCPPEDPEALANAVRSLYSLNEGERAAMGSRGRYAAVNHYNRRHLVARIEQMITDAATGARPTPPCTERQP